MIVRKKRAPEGLRRKPAVFNRRVESEDRRGYSRSTRRPNPADFRSQHGCDTFSNRVYTRDGDFMMILNFYARTNNGRDTHVFWPFVKFSDGELKRAVPFWFKGDNGEFVIFPFVKEDKDSFLWTVPPVYFKKDGSMNAVYPFYVKTDESLFVFPDIYAKNDGRRESLDVFPFYHHSRPLKDKGGESELRVLNVVSEESRLKKTFAVVPFYGRTDYKGGSRGHLFATLYHSRWDASRKLTEYGVLPFFGVKRSESMSRVWALNYYSYKSKTREEFAVYPFYGEKRVECEYNGRVRESSWALWPFYSKEEVHGADGSLISRRKRFMFFTNELDERGRRTFSVLGKVVREKVD